MSEKLVILITPRTGAERALGERLSETAERVANKVGLETRALLRLADDAFGPVTRWGAALELRPGRGAQPGEHLDCIEGLGETLSDVAHVDLSAALLGEEHRIIPGPATPVHYQYVMRRRADFTREAYFDHYFNIHAGFGRRTPGIRGYSQIHLDPEASRRAVRAAGLAIWAADSISELHLDSVEEFATAVASSPVAEEAPADEENFVDRRCSFDFVCEVLAHHRPD